MNRNFIDHPYNEKDAERFVEMFKNYSETPAPQFDSKQATGFKKGDRHIALANLRMVVKDVKSIYAEATRMGGGNFQVQELGRFIAYRCQAEMIPGPIKSIGGAFRKLGLSNTDKAIDPADRYLSAGDLKDIVRVTIVAESTEQYRNIISQLVRTCVSQYHMSVRKNAEIFADRDTCGYSGACIVATLPCKQPGEVQVNVRSIMYGKMVEGDFCRDLGVSIDSYHALSKRYGIEGGLGHVFYEIYRVDKKGPNGLEAARLSKLYYDLLRRPSIDAGTRMFFKRGLDAFKKQNEALFAGH